MSTISAEVKRTDSVRSFSNLSRKELGSSDKQSTPGPGTSTSTSGGVSHFLTSTSVATTQKQSEDDSDDDEASTFLSNYKPQPVERAEKPRTLNKARLPSVPSRTQQRLELQRREIMRAGGGASSTPPAANMALTAGSSVSLHSRSGSQGRIRSSVGDPKAMRLEYDVSVKQFAVVRRFQNPILDSLHRLQDSKVIPSDASSSSTSGPTSKSRPQSRRGLTSGTTTPKVVVSRSPEDKKMGDDPRATNANPRVSKVQFQLSRQGSHDDIGLTTSQGSPENYGDENDGMSPEEALIRRIWESNYVRE